MESKGQFGYTVREERLNALSHTIATFVALFGIYVMLRKTFEASDIYNFIGAIIFSLSLFATFASSALYHGLKDGSLKMLAKRIDHVSIYFVICGIYTALILACARNYVGLVLGIILWVLGILGVFYKFYGSSNGTKKWSLWSYIFMASLVLAIFPYMPKPAILFILAAGILDSIGIYFYLKKDKEFYHVIWHCFSFSAGTCDFFAVYYAIGLS